MSEDKELKVSRFWQELFIEKEANPLDQRSDKAFCDENGINYGSFRTWLGKNRKSVYAEVNKRRKDFLAEARTVAHKELMKKLGKDTNALKLFFQLAGDLVEKIENRTEIMTPADQRRRINDLLKEIEAKTAKRVEGGTSTPTENAPISPNVPEQEPRADSSAPGTL